MIAPWLRLGLRLAVAGGHRAAGRLALMACGVAVGTVVLLGALSVPAVISEQAAREQARTPVLADTPAAGGVRMVPVDDAIGARPLTRVAVAADGRAQVLPPGVAVLPAAGEVVVSPALARLLEVDERVRGRFPQRVVGTIGPAGLMAPDELRAYVGVPTGQVPAEVPPVVGFGSAVAGRTASTAAGAAWADAFTTERVMAFAFALFLLAPLGVFLATCARLSAVSRDRRLAAIRLLGATRRQAQLVNAGENALVTAVGATLGTVLFVALRPLSGSWHLGRFHWYPADARVSAPMIVAVGVALTGYAVLVAAVASAPAIRSPLAARRDAPAAAPSPRRLLILAVGAVLVAAAALAPAGFTVRAALLAAGVLTCAAGLPLALPVLTSRAGRAFAAVRVPVALRLAGRRLDHTPSVAPRLVAGIVVCVFVSAIGLVAASTYAAWTRPGEHNGVSTLSYDLPAGNAALVPDLRAQPFVIGVAATRTLPGVVTGQPHPVPVLVADCADLRHMFTGAQDCRDGQAYPASIDGTDATDTTTVEITTGDKTINVPVAATKLTLQSRLPSSRNAAIVVTRTAPAWQGQPPAPDSIIVSLHASEADTDRLYQFLAVHAPAIAVQGYTPVQRGFDPAAMLTLIAAGLAIAVLLSGAAFAAAATDRVIERRPANSSLAVLGTPRRQLAATELAFLAIPLAMGVAIALAAAALVLLSAANLLNLDPAQLSADAAPAVWATIAVLLAALAVVPAASRHRITPEHLRRQ
ncbi:FtsX-like permease family protein [Micromonospora sp. B11E3]|uniref:FtsX-like permease family protein n=1 Tax=Micromonospora sp. B11E3 TaxID=3153562 RepID=UPI00325E5493